MDLPAEAVANGKLVAAAAGRSLNQPSYDA